MSRQPYGEIPYVLRKDNIVVSRSRGTKGESQAFAVYEIYQHHSEFRKEEDLFQELLTMESVLARLKYSGQFSLVPALLKTDEVLRVDESDVPTAFQDPYENSIRHMKSHMLRKPFEYHLYLTINVKELSGNPMGDFFSAVWEALRDPARKLEAKLGGIPFTLAASQWERFLNDEKRTFSLLKRHFAVRRLSFEEVGIFIERSAMRGVEPRVRSTTPEIQKAGPILVSSPMEIVPAFEDVEHNVKEVPGMIKFQKVFPEGVKEGYFSFLTIGSLPKGESLYPDSTALFRIIQDMFKFPVELNVSFYPLDWNYLQYQLKATRFWSRSKRTSKAKRGAEVDQSLIEIFNESGDLTSYLTSNGFHMFKTQITLVVWGNTPEQVVERRELVADTLKGYQVHVPVYLQKQLFYNTLPGNPKKMGYQYSVMATPRWLSAMSPLGSIQLGDPSGYLIGYTGPLYQDVNEYKIPVLFDPRRGTRDKKHSTTPSVINFGSPGTGKSLLANYKVIQNVLRGAKALIFDPKNERWAWPYEIPWLADSINIVTLREGLQDKGKLDPLLRVNGSETDRSAINSAKRILWYLSGWEVDSFGGKAVGYAIDLVAAEYQKSRPCMKRVIEVLKDYLAGKMEFNFPDYGNVPEKARSQVAELIADLEYNSNSSLAQLLFGDGDEKSINLSYPLTILQVSGLTRPKKDDPDYRLHMAVIMGICDLAREFVEQEAKFRSVMFDEFHEFSEEPEIRSMVRSLLRKGRSMNNSVQLITHNTRDLVLDRDLDEEDSGSEVRSNLGVRFVYRIDDRSEARKSCEILGIPPTEDILDLITDRRFMRSGDFLMRDFEGRVGFVHFPIDQIDPELFEALRTDEEANKRRIRKYGHLRRTTTQVISIEKNWEVIQ